MVEQASHRTRMSIASFVRAALLASSGVIVLVCAVSVLLGLLAFVAAPRLDSFGQGPGGLWGIPMMALMLSVALAVPALLYAVTRLLTGHVRDAGLLLPAVLPWIIVVGHFAGAHAMDPCARGLLAPSAEFLGAPLCGDWYGRPETAARLHLLHHGLVPTLPLVVLQVWLTRRFAARVRLIPEG